MNFFDTRGTLELSNIRWLPYSLEFSSFQFFDKCNCPCLDSLNESQTSISKLGKAMEKIFNDVKCGEQQIRPLIHVYKQKHAYTLLRNK